MPALPIAQVAPEFADALGSHASSRLDQSPHSAYGIWPDGRLAYLNRGWFDFARDNEGDALPSRWGLGASIWDAIPPLLTDFYAEGFEGALGTGKPWHHRYECSSPSLLREFHMLAYPLASSRGLLIVNSLLLELPHPLRAGDRSAARYVDEDGLIRQCVHCRRVRRVKSRAWDWIPPYVREHPPNMTGGMCASCFSHHYPSAPAPPHDCP